MSAPVAVAPAVAGPVQPVANANVLMAVLNRLKEYSGSVFKQRKPWNEVIDRTAFSKPANVAEAASRLRKNAAYFKVNYLIVMLITTAATFAMHPTSLLVVGILMTGWVYVFLMRTTPLAIGGRTLSEREKLLGMSGLSFITIFFLTSVGTVFFSALSLSLAVIAAHGALREPDNLFIDDGQAENQSLLSIFTTPVGAPTALSSNV